MARSKAISDRADRRLKEVTQLSEQIHAAWDSKHRNLEKVQNMVVSNYNSNQGMATMRMLANCKRWTLERVSGDIISSGCDIASVEGRP